MGWGLVTAMLVPSKKFHLKLEHSKLILFEVSSFQVCKSFLSFYIHSSFKLALANLLCEMKTVQA